MLLFVLWGKLFVILITPLSHLVVLFLLSYKEEDKEKTTYNEEGGKNIPTRDYEKVSVAFCLEGTVVCHFSYVSLIPCCSFSPFRQGGGQV